ncbi:MAG: translocation/assembly module TamB domain-containing protein [Deltaproteobacteria bacterium]|nr:translocation/assembly module TamB domain-containing protein [Deltaproteobacteria bacterium]MBN2844513.1 translocation/assembly module TamB domain-containing protein [Deltaproteobacteria bacterium]
MMKIHKLIKYMAIITGMSLALVVFFIAISILSLKIDYGQRFVQTQLNERIPGSITWNSLRFSLVSGEMEFTGGTVKDPDGEGIILFDQLFIHILWDELWQHRLTIASCIIQKPRIDIRVFEDGSLNVVRVFTTGKESGKEKDVSDDEEAKGGIPFNIIVKDLEMKDGLLRYTASASGITTALEMIDLSATFDMLGEEGTLVLQTEKGTIETSSIDTDFDHLDCEMEIANGIVSLTTFRGNIASGSFDMEGTMDFRTAFPGGFFDSLSTPDTIAYQWSFKETGVNLEQLIKDGKVRGIVTSAFSLEGRGFSPETLFARLTGEMTAAQVAVGNDRAPIDANLTVKTTLEGSVAILEALTAKAGMISMDGKGRVDLRSQAVSADLTLDAPDLSDTLSSLGVEDIAGETHLSAHLTGTIQEPAIESAIKGDRIRLGDFTVGDIETKVALDSSGVLRIHDLTVKNGNSALEASGTVQLLDKFVFVKNPAFQLDFKSGAIFLENFTNVIKGTVSLSGHCDGTVTEPKGTVEVSATELDLGVQKIEKLTLFSRLDNGRIFVEPLRIVVAGQEEIEGTGWIAFDKTYAFELASGDIALHSLDVLRDQEIAEGRVMLNLSGGGSLEDPRIAGRVTLHDVRIEGKEFNDFIIDLDVHEWIATIMGKLNFDVEGSYHLLTKDFSASARFNKTELAPYFVVAGTPELRGSATGIIAMNGNAGTPEKTKVSADLPEISLIFKGNRLLYARGLKATYGEGTVEIPPIRLELLEDGHLEIEGKGKLDGSFELAADGKLPLEALKPFIEDLHDLAGDVILSVRMEGTADAPALKGRIELVNVGLTIPGLLQKLHDVTGLIEVERQTVTIASVKGYLDSGMFDIAGSVAMEGFRPSRLDILLTASSLPLQLPDTMDVLLNADLKVEGTADKSTLRGEVVLLEGTYYRDVNLSFINLVTERKRQETPPQRREITYPFLKNMSLDISVKGRNPFVIDNNLAQMDVTPDLRIAGTLNNPAIRGRAEVDSGTITYQKKAFAVKKGVIDFLNPYKIEPTIDMAGDVRVRKWLISLNISGTPERLNFKLISEPPEEDGDILSLLLFGKTTQELTGEKGGTAQSTKEMLAEMVAATFGEDIRKSTGLDIFEVETGMEENEAASERVKVTLGKKLSRRMTVKYSAETRDGEMIQRAIAEYKFLEHILLSGFQDTRGIFGGGLLLRLEFR